MRYPIFHVINIDTGALSVMPAPYAPWLRPHIGELRGLGVTKVLSLLEETEEAELHLQAERPICAAHHLAFERFPIRDRGVPEPAALAALVKRVLDEIRAGEHLAVHCRGGIGRTGLVASCLLVASGMEPEPAMRLVSLKRTIPVPETPTQRAFVHADGGSRP
jgi:protein-tyrosine phosphatase